MTDRRRFIFTANGRTADASAIGAEHVGLALSTDGIAVSLMLPLDEAKALVNAVQEAITYAENVIAETGLGESAVEGVAT